MLAVWDNIIGALNMAKRNKFKRLQSLSIAQQKLEYGRQQFCVGK